MKTELDSKTVIKQLDVLSAKAERGLPPVRETERERDRERERERFTDFYRYRHDSKHAKKASTKRKTLIIKEAEKTRKSS